MEQPAAPRRAMVTAAMSLSRLLDAARATPQRTALIVDGEVAFTYAQLENLVSRWSAALDGAGVRPGQRVAVLAAAGPVPVAAAMATPRLGAAATLMNPALTAEELATLRDVAHCCDVGVADEEHAAALSGVLDGTVVTPSDLASAATPRDTDVEVAPEDDAIVLFTSGTTGVPKAVAIPHAALETRLDALALPFDPDAKPAVRMTCVPLFHVGGLLGLLRNLHSGGTTVVQSRFDAGEWLRLVERHRVIAVFLVPAMLRRILDHPAFATSDLRSLESIAYGAAPAPADLVQRAVAALPWVAFSSTFGQTETLGGIASLTPEDHRDPRRAGTVGRPLDGVRTRVVDPDTGSDVATGAAGELWVMAAQTVRPGWLRTGDLVSQDADGYLRFCGRLAATINRGGEKLMPEEIEAAVRSHPDVLDAAVAGIPDEVMGERVGLAVTTRRPLSAAELREHCGKRLARFKVPELIAFVDALPYSAVGKIDRRRLQQLIVSPQSHPKESDARRP